MDGRPETLEHLNRTGDDDRAVSSGRLAEVGYGLERIDGCLDRLSAITSQLEDTLGLILGPAIGRDSIADERPTMHTTLGQTLGTFVERLEAGVERLQVLNERARVGL